MSVTLHSPRAASSLFTRPLARRGALHAPAALGVQPYSLHTILNWTYIYVENFTNNQNKFLFSQNGRIFVFYDSIRSGLPGKIEIISREFPNLGIRSGYVQFALFLHSGAFRGRSNMIYAHTIPHGTGRKYPYPTIFSVQRRKCFNLKRIVLFSNARWNFNPNVGPGTSSRSNNHNNSDQQKIPESKIQNPKLKTQKTNPKI